MSLSIILDSISDPRRTHLQKHSLKNILIISFAAVIGGAESWREIEMFGKTHFDFFKSCIPDLTSIPSHDTFNRVFSLINPAEFEKGFRAWVYHTYGDYKGVIAIDGKELCGARTEDEDGKMLPLRMVTAWATEAGISLAQERVGEKTNEIKAIPELLKILDLKDCVVTIDAIGCQHAIVESVIEHEGDYLIAVKENQKKLHDTVTDWFTGVSLDGIKKDGSGQLPPSRYQLAVQENTGHGRTEKRICRVISYGKATSKILGWAGVKSVVCIESTRTNNKTGETSCENRYYITSLKPDAEKILDTTRKHWAIENNLHWQLDVSFNEDNQRKKKNAAQNMSLINKFALARLKRDKSEGSIKGKRKRAGWDVEFLRLMITVW